MATSLSVKGCKPGRTPQETSEELLLVGGERRLHGLLHCGDSTSNRASVNCVRRYPALVRHELVRDVQRRHDRDALVARDLARIAHFLELAVEVVGRGQQLLASADYLNRKLKEVRDTGKVAGNERVAIMAALNIAHELVSNKGGVTANAVDGSAIRRRISAMQETVEAALAADQEKLF